MFPTNDTDAGDGRQIPDEPPIIASPPPTIPLDDRPVPVDPAHRWRVRLIAGMAAREIDRLPTDVSPASRRQRVGWIWRRAGDEARRLDRWGRDPRELGPYEWAYACRQARTMVAGVLHNLRDGAPLALMFPLPIEEASAS